LFLLKGKLPTNMTTRQNRYVYTSDLKPVENEATHKWINSIRAVVDTISCPEQEAQLNKYLSRNKGWGDDGVYIKSNDAIQIAYGADIGGDCYLKSLECYWKLRGAGAKRFCGRRTALNVDTDEHPHYWVECNGMVFDCGGGQQKIGKKDHYYETMKIQGEREGNDMGCFRSCKYERMLEKKSRIILEMCGIKSLIKFIGDLCRTNNAEDLANFKKSVLNKRS